MWWGGGGGGPKSPGEARVTIRLRGLDGWSIDAIAFYWRKSLCDIDAGKLYAICVGGVKARKVEIGPRRISDYELTLIDNTAFGR